jgi:shikimate dehydrogenase
VITGTTKIYFMIAHPIDHVRSPEVFNPIFVHREIDAVMTPLHYLPDQFEAAWAGLRYMQNLGGIIVSIPFKELCYRLSDSADGSAVAVRAANTVRREKSGKLTCANFDGPGFMTGLLNDGRDAVGKRALLIGAGGAGTSIAFSLADAGVRYLAIHDTDSRRAESLSARVRERHPGADIGAAVDNSPRGFDLIVNATPAGLHPETDPLPVPVEHLVPGMLVADIVMKPAVTPLLAAAKSRGCEVRCGAGMLNSQADLMMKFFGFA